MPNMDGSGPRGMGPGTGRGFGPCGAGRGFGRGFGRGMGYYNCPMASGSFLTKKREKEMLNEEISLLEEELEAIKERLGEING